jgi:predicted AAA+ superfamily ATPase
MCLDFSALTAYDGYRKLRNYVALQQQRIRTPKIILDEIHLEDKEFRELNSFLPESKQNLHLSIRLHVPKTTS